MVIASWGDNITPPPQALNWIPDLYETVDEIRAHEQVIVYTLDQRIGHLGIFVSAKVAEKQHAEIVNTIDLIGSLPPGLYEMIIEDKRPRMSASTFCRATTWCASRRARSTTSWRSTTGARTRRRSRRWRGSRRSTRALRHLVSPWVRLWANDATAEALRMMHPLRLERFAISDMNPMMGPLQVMAHVVRENRRPVAADNPFVTTEQAVSQQIEKSLDLYRDMRDRTQELLFKAIYNSPLIEALAGCARRTPTPASRAPGTSTPSSCSQPRSRRSGPARSRAALPRPCCASCWPPPRPSICSMRGFRLAQRIKQEHPVLRELSREWVRAAAKEQAFMLRFDQERALALPRLLPTEEERRGLGYRAPDRLRGWRDHAGERGHARKDRAHSGARPSGQGQAAAACRTGKLDQSEGRIASTNSSAIDGSSRSGARDHRH